MSIFSRRRKFRNLVSSVISTVLLSSCTSQVAQCWKFRIKFDPEKNRVFLNFECGTESHDKLCGTEGHDKFRIFDIYEKPAVSIYNVSKYYKDGKSLEKAYEEDFLPFSSRRGSAVKEFAAMLRVYFKKCLDLFYGLGYENEDAFFEMLGSTSNSTLRNCDLEMSGLASNSTLGKCDYLEPNDQIRVIELRELSDEIKKKYDDLNYVIISMFLDKRDKALCIVTDKGDNADISRSNYFRLLDLLDGFETKFKAIQILEEDRSKGPQCAACIRRHGELYEIIESKDFGRIMYCFDHFVRDCDEDTSSSIDCKYSLPLLPPQMQR